jgi:hypothetical protein
VGCAFGTYREREGCVTGKPERKRKVSRPRRRLEDIVQIDLQEI